MNKKKQLIISIVGMLLLVMLTVGVTFAVFTYTKLGTTENTVTTGTLKFLYTENTGVGNGINIENAFPVSDEVGKSYNTDKYVFDFSVEATNSGTEEIPYEVTLRKKSTSTLPESYIKVYFTDMTENADSQIIDTTFFNDLSQTNIDVGENVEKTLYTGTVLGGELDYLKEFRLRMWIDEKSNQDDINGKNFTAMVNVYSNVPLVSDEEIAVRDDTRIKDIFANQEKAETSDQDYDYIASFEYETSSVDLVIETENELATVEVTKIEKTAAVKDNIVRLASTKTFRFDLEEEDNLFKVKVTSANKRTSEEYIVNIYREPLCPYDIGQTWTYNYTGSPQVFTTPCAGIYKIETYGASGQGINSQGSTRGGGLGTYVYGNIELERNFDVNIYVGGKGATNSAGYNGGGSGTSGSGGGGGATDIRINGTAIADRILVAGGGGGGPYFSNRGEPYDIETIEYGNAVGTLNSTLGQGNNGTRVNYSGKYFACGGGGGGYYGGYSNATICNSNRDQCTWQGGGSSYINTSYFFNYDSNTKTKTDITYTGTNGLTDFTTSNLIHYQNSGNGRAIITLMSK